MYSRQFTYIYLQCKIVGYSEAHLPMRRRNVSPAMLRSRIRFMTKITLIRSLIRGMVVSDYSFTDHITLTYMNPRVQRQVTLGTERFVAQRTNVNFMLLRRMRKDRGILSSRGIRVVLLQLPSGAFPRSR